MTEINITDNPDTDSKLVLGMQALSTRFKAKRTANDDGSYRYELICESLTPLEALYVDHISYGASYLFCANGKTMKVGFASENPQRPSTL
jgi:hypothetical protein